MRKFRAFPMILTMVATMVAGLLSATPSRAQEAGAAADTDATEVTSNTDAAPEKDAEEESESADTASEATATETEAAPETAEAAVETSAETTGAEASVSANVASSPAPETEAETEAADKKDDTGLSLSIGAADINMRIYGFLNAQLEMVQATGGDTTPYALRGRISDGNSRIGFKGDVELVKGLQAIWQIEASFGGFEQGGLDDKGLLSSFVSRNSFVGINHDKAGRLIFGHNDSVYRSMVGSAGDFGGSSGLKATGLDLWNNTTAQMSGNRDSLFGRGEARYTNSLHYTTPLFYGIQLGGSVSFDELTELARFRNRFSAALTYEYKGFKIGGGYDYQKNTGVDQVRIYEGLPFNVGAADDVATSFAKGLVGYVTSSEKYKTSVSAGIEYAMYGYSSFLYLNGDDELPELAEGTMSQLGVMGSASQGIGFGLTLMVSGGALLGLNDAVIGDSKDYKAWQISGGIKYELGENFATYLFYTHIENESRQNVNFGQAPLYTNNLGTSDAYLSPGNDPRSLGLGVMARF